MIFDFFFHILEFKQLHYYSIYRKSTFSNIRILADNDMLKLLLLRK